MNAAGWDGMGWDGDLDRAELDWIGRDWIDQPSRPNICTVHQEKKIRFLDDDHLTIG